MTKLKWVFGMHTRHATILFRAKPCKNLKTYMCYHKLSENQTPIFLGNFTVIPQTSINPALFLYKPQGYTYASSCSWALILV